MEIVAEIGPNQWGGMVWSLWSSRQYFYICTEGQMDVEKLQVLRSEEEEEEVLICETNKHNKTQQ